VTRGAWLLTRKHPPSVGGMQQLSWHLVQELATLRPVTVLAWGRGQWGLPWFFLMAFARLLPALAFGRVSVLHLGDPVLAPLAVLPRWFGVPVAVTVHGLDVEYPAWWYQAYLRVFFWARMQAYVCISRHVRDLVLARGIDPQQVLVIPVGIGESGAAAVADPAIEAKLEGQGPILLSVGRLVERKGLPWFLQAVAPRFFDRHPRARLLVAGEGPQRAAIETAIAAGDLGDRVHLLGAVDESRKAWLLARCDLVLMPNVPVPGDAEGFGLVALEAGRAGRWPLVADLEGLRDAVTDECNGQRIPAGDADAWLAALELACADLHGLHQKGQLARDYVLARFTWAAMAGKYHRLFSTLEAHAH
jgi:phosphatidylinositol alpha-1,6-mannosyltransferase